MTTSASKPQGKPFLSGKEIVVGLIIVILFAAAYALTLNSYIQEGQNNSNPFVIGDEKMTDGVVANAKVLSIDPVKGEMAVRIDLTPTGALTETDGLTATSNLKVITNSATGNLERSFDKGKTISPFDIVISLDGLVNDYPFDTYSNSLILYVTSQENKDAEEVDVPVLINLTANIPGYAIDISADKESSPTYSVANLEVARSSTVKTVAIAGMVIMWTIGIATIFLTMSFVFRNRKAEAFAFYSGLLFGLFGLRNSLPGTPAIGTQSDFLSFLWVEAIVAIMMVVTITVSLLRPQK
jgi:hypothetical protein